MHSAAIWRMCLFSYVIGEISSVPFSVSYKRSSVVEKYPACVSMVYVMNSLLRDRINTEDIPNIPCQNVWTVKKIQRL